MSKLDSPHIEELEAAKTAISATLQGDANTELLFGSPIDSSVLPDYHTVITQPKDLGTILSDIEASLDGDGKYTSAEEVLKDVHLVWRNCYQYNNRPEDAAIRKLCRNSIKLFEDEWKKVPRLASIDPSFKKSSKTPSKAATKAGRPPLHPGDSQKAPEILPTQLLTNFEIRSPSSGHALQGLEHLEAERNAGGTLTITGTIIPPPQTQEHASSEQQTPQQQQATLLSNEPIMDWAIEYTPSGSFNMWIATQSAWLQLQQPSERYSQIYEHALQCATFTATLMKELPAEDNGMDLQVFVDSVLSSSSSKQQVDGTEQQQQQQATAEVETVSKEIRDFAVMQMEAKLGRRRPRPGTHKKRKLGATPGTGKRPRGMSKAASKSRLGVDAAAEAAFLAGDEIDAISDDDIPDDFAITAIDEQKESEKKISGMEATGVEAVVTDGVDDENEKARRRAWKEYKYWQRRTISEEKQRRIQEQRHARETAEDDARGAPPSMTSSFRLPPHCVPNILMVWEFVHTFGDVLQIAPFSLSAFEAALQPGPRVLYKDDEMRERLIKEAEEEEKAMNEEKKKKKKKGGKDGDDDVEMKEHGGDGGDNDDDNEEIKKEDNGDNNDNVDNVDDDTMKKDVEMKEDSDTNNDQSGVPPMEAEEQPQEANGDGGDETEAADTPAPAAAAADNNNDDNNKQEEQQNDDNDKTNNDADITTPVNADANDEKKDDGEPSQPSTKRKRGRPPGSKNKTTHAQASKGIALQNIIDDPTIKTRGQRGIPPTAPRRSDMVPSSLTKGGKGKASQSKPKDSNAIAAALSAAAHQQQRFSIMLKRKYGMTTEEIAAMSPIDKEYACSTVLLRDLVCALSRAALGNIDPEENSGNYPRSARITNPSNEHPPWTERAAIAAWSLPTSTEDARMAALKLTYGDFVDLTAEERLEMLVAMVHAVLSTEKMVAEVNARIDAMTAEVTRRDGGPGDELDDEDGRLAAAAAAAVIVPPPPPPALPSMMADGTVQPPPPPPPPPTAVELWQRWSDAQHTGIRRPIGVDFRGRRYWVLGRHAGAFRVFCEQPNNDSDSDDTTHTNSTAIDDNVEHLGDDNNTKNNAIVENNSATDNTITTTTTTNTTTSSSTWGWYEGSSVTELIDWLSKATISSESSLITVLRAMPSPLQPLQSSTTPITPSKRPESIELALHRADGYKGLNLPLLCGDGNSRGKSSGSGVSASSSSSSSSSFTVLSMETRMAQAVESLLGAIPFWFREQSDDTDNNNDATVTTTTVSKKKNNNKHRYSLLQKFFAIIDIISSSSSATRDAAHALLETEHLLCEAGRLTQEWIDVWQVQWRHYVLNHADHKELPLCIAALQTHVKLSPDVIPRQAYLKVATDINYSLNVPCLGDVVVVLRSGLLKHIDRYIELLHVKASTATTGNGEQLLQQDNGDNGNGDNNNVDGDTTTNTTRGGGGGASVATTTNNSIDNSHNNDTDDNDNDTAITNKTIVMPTRKRGRRPKNKQPQQDVVDNDNDDDDQDQQQQRPKSAIDNRNLPYLPAPMILESSLPAINEQWQRLREDVAALRPVERFVVRSIIYRRHLTDYDDISTDPISENSPRIPVAWLCLRPAQHGPPHQLPVKDIVVPLALVLNLPDYLMSADAYVERSRIAWQPNDRFRIFIGGKISAKTQKKVKSGGIWKKGTVVDVLSSVPHRRATVEEKEQYDPWSSLVVSWDNTAAGSTEHANPWEIEIDPEEETRKADDARRAQQAAARAQRARTSSRRDPGDPGYAEQAAEWEQEDRQLAELTQQGDRASYLLNVFKSKPSPTAEESTFNDAVYGTHVPKAQSILADSHLYSVSKINAAAKAIGLHAAVTSYGSVGAQHQHSNATTATTTTILSSSLTPHQQPSAQQPAIPSAPLVRGQEVSPEILDALRQLSSEQFTTMVSNFYRGYRGKFKIPIFAHHELDIHKVWWCVMDRGGYETVTSGKLWKDVCRSMEIDLSGQTSASYNMRTNYERCLLDFENYLASGKYEEDVEEGRAPVHTRVLDVGVGYYTLPMAVNNGNGGDGNKSSGKSGKSKSSGKNKKKVKDDEDKKDDDGNDNDDDDDDDDAMEED